MRARGGISLLEIVIAVTTACMALTLVVGMLPSATLSSRLARQRTVAGGLAQDYLESLDPSGAGTLAAPSDETLTVNGTPYRRRVKVVALPLPSRARRVEVEVEWTRQETATGQALHRVHREMVIAEVQP